MCAATVARSMGEAHAGRDAKKRTLKMGQFVEITRYFRKLAHERSSDTQQFIELLHTINKAREALPLPLLCYYPITENGKRKAENGKRKAESGKRRTEN